MEWSHVLEWYHMLEWYHVLGALILLFKVVVLTLPDNKVGSEDEPAHH
jgi:hypothetical protein